MSNNSQPTTNNRQLTTDKKWVVAERQHSSLLEHLLRLRQIDDRASFFDPQFPEDLPDPFLMLGMDRATDRIAQALAARDTIGILADYDADGTPGAALLGDGLRQLGSNVVYYIPTRTEGYGLSERGLQALADAGARVVITIDLGVTGKKLVAYGRDLGLDIIIADHHTIQSDVFPDAAWAVLNPKQADCAYPDKDLCGAGIAWKLLCGLVDWLKRHAPEQLRGRNPEAITRWTLDLAGLATMADMVPLRGENRVLAIYGLKVLAKTRRPGLRALYHAAGIDPTRLSATTVGFQIAPRLNAPTRLAADSYAGADFGPQASLTLALLLTEDEDQARTLAGQLVEFNARRQEQLKATLAAAEQQIIDESLTNDKILIVAGEGWPEGIVGLVAARLLERYHRPTLVLSLSEEFAAGSARSIDQFPLVSHFEACREWLVSFGGHHQAAGLRARRADLAALRVALKNRAARLSDADLAEDRQLDAELSPAELTLATATDLERFAPFGMGNPRPTFLLSKVRIIDQRLIGQAGHHLAIRAQFGSGSQEIFRLVGWGLADERQQLAVGTMVDLAIQMERGFWQDRPQLDLKIVAHRPSQELAKVL